MNEDFSDLYFACDTVEEIIRRRLSTYVYTNGQHKAAAKHAKAIHDLGGLAHVIFNSANRSLSLMTDFERVSDRMSIYESDRMQRVQKRDIANSTKNPTSVFGHAFIAACIGGIASCSYNVAPKSEDEIISWGTIFAAWGTSVVIRATHAHIVFLPNAQKMLRTAANIIDTNRRIIAGWKAEEPASQPQ